MSDSLDSYASGLWYPHLFLFLLPKQHFSHVPANGETTAWVGGCKSTHISGNLLEELRGSRVCKLFLRKDTQEDWQGKKTHLAVQRDTAIDFLCVLRRGHTQHTSFSASEMYAASAQESLFEM